LAYVNYNICRGDYIVSIDGRQILSEEEAVSGLLGSDIPGTTVVVGVSRICGREWVPEVEHVNIEVVLTRMATESIADRRRIFELFTILKVSTTMSCVYADS
jgi:hypothetical protein